MRDSQVKICVSEKTYTNIRTKLKELFRMGRGHDLESFIR